MKAYLLWLATIVTLGAAMVYVGVRVSMWLDALAEQRRDWDREFADIVERLR